MEEPKIMEELKWKNGCPSCSCSRHHHRNPQPKTQTTNAILVKREEAGDYQVMRG
ncbi:hypothetical protein Sjap_013177 [Stephania japonica]|uniref:Uncharacterized protein n=1 Tax=Stephania japonica TaxID=461633 RepID=A0AAP0IY79_9MAGN